MKMDIIYGATDDLLITSMPWPGMDVMEEMGDPTFAGLISTLQVDAMVFGSGLRIRIGDSKNIAYLNGQMARGEEGLCQLREMAGTFEKAVRASMDSMSDGYRKLYGAALKDFDENGYDMPHAGRLL